jgi:hypothetical protein
LVVVFLTALTGAIGVAAPNANAACVAGPDGDPWCNVQNNVDNVRPKVPAAVPLPPDPTYALYSHSDSSTGCYSAVSAPDFGFACVQWGTTMGVWVNGFPEYPPLVPNTAFHMAADSYMMHSNGVVQFISLVANETISHDEPAGGEYVPVKQWPSAQKQNGVPVEYARDQFSFQPCASQSYTVSICAHHVDSTGFELYYKPAAEGRAVFGPALAMDGDTAYLGRSGDTEGYVIVNCSAIHCI